MASHGFTRYEPQPTLRWCHNKERCCLDRSPLCRRVIYNHYSIWVLNNIKLNCRLETSDVLIKGGEWKLGIDEEPLPFQIVKVATIIRHPQYVAGSYQNDLALLVLTEKLRLAKNVGTICLPPANQIPANNCVATGWGKRILQCKYKILCQVLNY